MLKRVSSVFVCRAFIFLMIFFSWCSLHISLHEVLIRFWWHLPFLRNMGVKMEPTHKIFNYYGIWGSKWSQHTKFFNYYFKSNFDKFFFFRFLMKSCYFNRSVTIITNIVSSNPAHGEVCSKEHYVIKFVSDLRYSCLRKLTEKNKGYHMETWWCQRQTHNIIQLFWTI